MVVGRVVRAGHGDLIEMYGELRSAREIGSDRVARLVEVAGNLEGEPLPGPRGQLWQEVEVGLDPPQGRVGDDPVDRLTLGYPAAQVQDPEVDRLPIRPRPDHLRTGVRTPGQPPPPP